MQFSTIYAKIPYDEFISIFDYMTQLLAIGIVRLMDGSRDDIAIVAIQSQGLYYAIYLECQIDLLGERQRTFRVPHLLVLTWNIGRTKYSYFEIGRIPYTIKGYRQLIPLVEAGRLLTLEVYEVIQNARDADALDNQFRRFVPREDERLQSCYFRSTNRAQKTSSNCLVYIPRTQQVQIRYSRHCPI